MTKPISVPGTDGGLPPAGASDGPLSERIDASVHSAPAGSGAVRSGLATASRSATDSASEPTPAKATRFILPYPAGNQTERDLGLPQEPAEELPGARALWILAFTFAVVGLFFPLAGAIAIVCGALAWRKGSGRGKVATLVAVGTTIIGVIITVVLLTT